MIFVKILLCSKSTFTNRRTQHEDNRLNIRSDTINKMHGEIQWISVGRISSGLVHQFSELGYIFNDKSNLSDMKQLLDQQLVLITVEEVMEQTTKGGPTRRFQLGFDGLQPASRWAIKVHLSYKNPEGFSHTIRCEILLTERMPEARVVTTKSRKIELGEVACGGGFGKAVTGGCGGNRTRIARAGGGSRVLPCIGLDLSPGGDQPETNVPRRCCRVVPLGPVGKSSRRWAQSPTMKMT